MPQDWNAPPPQPLYPPVVAEDQLVVPFEFVPVYQDTSVKLTWPVGM